MCAVLGVLGGFEKLWTARPWPVEQFGGRGQRRVRAHLELCQCQSTQGQGQLSANFHGSRLAAVLFGRASSSEELTLQSPLGPSPQAKSFALGSDLASAEYVVMALAVIEGLAAMSNAGLVSYKIPSRVLAKVDSRCRRKNVRMGLDSF